MALPVFAAGAKKRMGGAGPRAAVDGHSVDWPCWRRLRRGVERKPRHGHRQERCLRGGRGVIRRWRPEPPWKDVPGSRLLPRRRRRERQLGRRRGSVQSTPWVRSGRRLRTSPNPSPAAQLRGGRCRPGGAARQADVQRKVQRRHCPRLHRCRACAAALPPLQLAAVVGVRIYEIG